jgi:ankyrin repeat protein
MWNGIVGKINAALLAAWTQGARDGELLHAARIGDLGSIARLLEQRADIDARDRQGMTPLMLAVANNHSEAARRLLDDGADVNAASKFGYTALMLVAGSGNAALAKLLLSRGADPDARNILNWSAAKLAELVGDEQVRAALLSPPAGTARSRERAAPIPRLIGVPPIVGAPRPTPHR